MQQQQQQQIALAAAAVTTAVMQQSTTATNVSWRRLLQARHIQSCHMPSVILVQAYDTLWLNRLSA
jgi:hypothetical protein